VKAALTPPQARALAALAPHLVPDFYLAGGVAVATYLHHRTSKDLDLFTRSGDPLALETIASRVAGARVTGRAPGTLHLEIDGVPVSLLKYEYPELNAPEAHEAIPLPVASVDDLIAMKLSAIAGRGARRDFWDLRALLEASSRNLEEALALFQRKYAQRDIGHVVRSLAYFGDAEAEPMPNELTEAEWRRIRAWFETAVRAL
jgi:hypothetical protein